MGEMNIKLPDKLLKDMAYFSHVDWSTIAIQAIRKEMVEQIAEQKEFAKRTEAAWKDYDKGKFKSMDADEFIKELKKW